MVWLKETDSTQDLLKRGDFPHGTVVVADVQKRGKGRKGRRWESQEGGLYFSFVLSAKNFKEIMQIPLVAGLSVSEALDSFRLSTSLKWPNDVYLKGRKVSGVLVERTGDKVVVGIGVNVNQTEFPEGIKDTAVSLKQVLRRDLNRVDVLTAILGRLQDNLSLFSEEGFPPFRERIEKRLLFKGEEVVILSESPGRHILLGIDEEGFLLLQTAEGVKRITAGEVSLRPSL
ncbi:MAG: biotin--[acetyl-CoA-carboxylase] ligase [Aquificota bacterium]|nr:biotin--[acetyl-CoA-carboxylase] ligase [Aquificota bacterium]